MSLASQRNRSAKDYHGHHQHRCDFEHLAFHVPYSFLSLTHSRTEASLRFLLPQWNQLLYVPHMSLLIDIMLHMSPLTGEDDFHFYYTLFSINCQEFFSFFLNKRPSALLRTASVRGKEEGCTMPLRLYVIRSCPAGICCPSGVCRRGHRTVPGVKPSRLSAGSVLPVDEHSVPGECEVQVT